jgi:hypothetical protein
LHVAGSEKAGERILHWKTPELLFRCLDYTQII